MINFISSKSVTPLRQLSYFVRVAKYLGWNRKDKLIIFWKETKNLRVRLGLGRHNLNEIYDLNTKYGRLYFRDNFGDITNLGNIFYREAYPIQQIVHDGVILDVGANIGLAAAWFHYHNPETTIYCFEPLKGNTEIIQKNCPTAIVTNVAIGAIPGRVDMMVDHSSVMASKIHRTIQTEVQTFPVNTLDQFTHDYNINQIALLKLDVEGMEFEVLQGGIKTLEKTHLIVMETHGQERHGFCLELLNDLGFAFKRVEFGTDTGIILAEKMLV